MKQTNQEAKPTTGENFKPEISRVTRRQLLAWIGVAGVAVIAGVGGLTLIRKSSSEKASASPKRFKLPDRPNHNPAYRAWATSDQGVVLWTHKQNKQFVGYRFNSNGRRIWQLCDGMQPAGEIATEYRAQTGRTKEEATDFLAQLQKMGIVVAGGYVVSAGAFPTPPEGGSYHPRLSASDPKTS